MDYVLTTRLLPLSEHQVGFPSKHKPRLFTNEYPNPSVRSLLWTYINPTQPSITHVTFSLNTPHNFPLADWQQNPNQQVPALHRTGAAPAAPARCQRRRSSSAPAAAGCPASSLASAPRSATATATSEISVI